MSQASRLRGAPSSLTTLAANLYVSGHSPQHAVDLLAALYEKATDESAKKLLETRLRSSSLNGNYTFSSKLSISTENRMDSILPGWKL